jgi:8-oxo-dGTP pyrophosphatase MutT (NUDIX family)
MRVVGCFLEYNDEFVLLRRHSHKPDGDTWGLPAGKVEEGESDEAAILRELFEETGYQARADQLQRLDEHPFSMPSGTTNDFVTYRVTLDRPHKVILEERSHVDFVWVNASKASAMNLIHGLPEIFIRIGLLS